MVKDNVRLFFIALIPPPDICAYVMAFKQDMRDRFGSKAAMKIIPHITLKAPFKFTADQDTELRQWFRSLELPKGPFPVQLDGFGCFPKPHSPVIFIQPQQCPALFDLQQSILNQFIAHHPDVPVADTEKDFHPHMTVAYRDLEPDMFRLAWQEYEVKIFKAEFLVEAVHLLRHNGNHWEVIDSRVLS